mmetsp:Transcript_12046/g.36584  ORF Transcript_12046/g.36584 Transcript_12046/m.36584 type:complete len:316 (-) Transcript_12046:298-1245(-)
MDGALHLVQHVVVGPAQQNGARGGGLGPLDHDDVVVAHTLLLHALGLAQGGRVKGLLTVHVRQGGDDGGTRRLGDPPEVVLGDPPARDGASLHKVLEGHVVNPLGGENDVGPCGEDLLDPLLRDVALLLPDLLELLGVAHQDLDSHLHPRLLQVHVQAGNLCVVDHLNHSLRCPAAVQGVALKELAFLGALSVGLENVDGLDRVLDVPNGVVGLHREHGVDEHVGKVVRVHSDDLGAHRRLGGVQQSVPAEILRLLGHALLEELAGLLGSQAVTTDDGGGVEALANEGVGVLQQLRGQDDDASRPVPDLLILHLR